MKLWGRIKKLIMCKICSWAVSSTQSGSKHH